MADPDPLLLGTAPRTVVPPAPRKAWLAVLLALVCDGLGHFYCGRVGAAVFWVMVPIVAAAGLLSIGVFLPERLPALVLIAVVLFVGARALQVVLAARLAQRSTDYRLRRVNAVPLYLAFYLLSWAAQNVAMRPFRARVIEPVKIPSASMAPTLLPGDQVFVLKAGPHAAIRRGDVVAYWFSDDKTFVKRAVALAGDTVELRNNTLWINGDEVPSRPCTVSTLTVTDGFGSHTAACWEEGGRQILADRIQPGSRANHGPQTVPPGHLFVLGDWRDNSEDSRGNGFVAADAVIGRVAVIWLSLDERWSIRWGRMGPVL